jgi:uncharacterized protein (TIGR03118 family)
VKSKSNVVMCRVFAVFMLLAGSAAAQSNAYRQTNLASDVAGNATHLAPGLANPWGIAFLPGRSFFIANNASGRVTTHNADGLEDAGGIGFIVPTTDGSRPDKPTGIVADPTGSFFIGGFIPQFIVAASDGTISGWGPDSRGDLPVQSTVAVDHSSRGAVYTGLAILRPACCTVFLAVADFHGGIIESFTRGMAGLATPGNFTDPTLPAGFAPFGIQAVGDNVFITYTRQDASRNNPVFGAGNGVVSVFDLEGNFLRRFATGGTLNAPWGVTQASAHFGAFSNDILIGNLGDGSISAFDPVTGNFAGQLTDSAGNVIRNSGLWGLTFRTDGVGDPDTLYFTAGIANEQHGLFGAIVAAGNGGTAPDFSVGASPAEATVAAGQSATFVLTISPLAGFTGNVSFSCSAPIGITCSFSPPSVVASSGPASTTMTTTTSASVMQYANSLGMLTIAFLGLGVIGTVIAPTANLRAGLTWKRLAGWMIGVASLLALAGCGYSNRMQANRGTATVLVTASAGASSHTTAINITVQ